MKAFVILSVFVASALCAKLDNTYVPPSAQSAGGYNLATPKQTFSSRNGFEAEPLGLFVAEHQYNLVQKSGPTTTPIPILKCKIKI